MYVLVFRVTYSITSPLNHTSALTMANGRAVYEYVPMTVFIRSRVRTMTPSSACRRRRLLLSGACWLFLTSVVTVSGWSEHRKTPVSGQLSQKDRTAVNQAMQATKQATGNITAAFDACNRWNQVLETSLSKDISESIRAICYALQASCLVRTGQDEEAIQVYDKAMELKDVLNNDTREDVILGKAYSFQRLMKYNEAREQFQLSTCPKATRGAATCALRLGDIDAALVLLKRQRERDLETNAMLATIQYLMAAEPSLEKSALDLLKKAGAFFPLYRWIHMSLSKSMASFKNDAVPLTSPLDLAALNTCAFDDHLLIHLDDKVLLHKLLRTPSTLPACEAFWPPGLILPTASATLSQSTRLENVRWVCKKRAGYGSHGNAIVDFEEAIQLSKTTGALHDELLLQRMIEPCLLLQGRKFSLRIYVVYFATSTASISPPDVFISTQGLVKLAARLFDDQSSSLDLGMHMTNSGREADALQEDLHFLRREFSQAGWSFGELWNDITEAVRSVMRTYDERARSIGGSIGGSIVSQDNETVPSRSHLAKLGLPKILGFDFIVDETRNVWLVEVNRFPGLEARDSKDASVKLQVIRDAWQMAGRRIGCDNDSWLKATLSNIDCSEANSLERIDL
jgi:tetratricopeptide (TPR) repeat protein